MSDTELPVGAEEWHGGWLTTKTVLLFVFWLCQVLFLEKHISKVSQMRPKNEEDVKRDEKYSCFRQSDIRTDSFINRIIMYFFCAPLIFLRMFVALLFFCMMGFWPWLTFALFPVSSPMHRPFLLFGMRIVGYGLMACSSVIWISKDRPKVCYKKYLGEDWEPTYEGQSTNIFNHSAWIDTLTMMTQVVPSFVAKASVRKLPFVGYAAAKCNGLFIDRVDKDSRAAMYESIAKYQEDAEKGINTPLNLAPEGGTTNGTAIIKFKRGAFAALRSIKPYGINYSSTIVPVQSGVIPFESHALLLGGNPFATCRIRELPVFKPNEFFWKNHQKDGEEKVETYMRVMRELMAENLGQKVIDMDINEKFDYRNLIWPSKKKGE